MTYPVSTIPAFKAALLARLQADVLIGAATPPVPILYGMPPLGQSDIGREFVLLGWTRDDDPTNGSGNFRGGWSTVSLGRNRTVEERYVLECAIVVVGPGIDGQQTSTERAFEIFQLVAQSLAIWQADSPPISGIVRWALVCGLRHQEGHPGEGFRAIVNFDIACSARLVGAGAP